MLPSPSNLPDSLESGSNSKWPRKPAVGQYVLWLGGEAVKSFYPLLFLIRGGVTNQLADNLELLARLSTT